MDNETQTTVVSQPSPIRSKPLAILSTQTATMMPSSTLTLMPDFAQFIVNYRQAEHAALLTLNSSVLEQLPVFAHGEALADIVKQVEALSASGQYQELVVENIQIQQMLDNKMTGVLATESHNSQIFVRTQEGKRLIEQSNSKLTIVYGLIFDEGRWKVDKVRIVSLHP